MSTGMFATVPDPNERNVNNNRFVPKGASKSESSAVSASPKFKSNDLRVRVSKIPDGKDGRSGVIKDRAVNVVRL